MKFDSEVSLSRLEEFNVFLIHESCFKYSILHSGMLEAEKI